MVIQRVSLTLILTLLLFQIAGAQSATSANPLKIFEQDYQLALATAQEDDKLLFVDFYTTWCGPCKQLDRLVFQNDSVQQLLGENIVLLRYDAEIDTVHHLSKKHHIGSYPTGLLLTSEGFVIKRKSGFPGEDTPSLSTAVLDFITEGVALEEEDKYVPGYSNDIDPTVYPQFYVKFVNRTDTKIDSAEVDDYLSSAEDVFSESYFSTLSYFAMQANDDIANATLENRDKYIALYGEDDYESVEIYLIIGKFSKAVKQADQDKFDQAISFAEEHLSEKDANSLVTSFRKDFLQSQNKWAEVLAINQEMKETEGLSNGYINHFSWQVYKDCEDTDVILKCVNWMKEVTDEEASFDYLDTYAYLLFKSGDKEGTKVVAQRAIEAGELEGRKTESLRKMMETL